MLTNVSNPIPSAARTFSTESSRFPALRASLFFLALWVWSWAAFIRHRELGSRLSLLVLAMIFLVIGAGALALRTRWSSLAANVQAGFRGSFAAALLVLLFLPEYLTHHPVPLLRSFLFLAVLGILFAGVFHAYRKEGVAVLTDRAAVRLATGLAILYLVVTSALSLWKLHVFGYVGQDIGYFMQCFYTALHGQLFHSNMYHDLLYSKRVTSDFAAHNQVVLFAFMPFYALHASAATMLMVRNVSMALCVWPAYMIARRYFEPSAALVATLGFVLTPAIFYQNLYDFAPLSLAGLPLLFALYFFLEDRFVPFVVALVLTQMVREDLVFFTIGCGLLALVWRRDWRWSVFPVVFGLAWGYLSWKIIFPHFLNGTTSVVQGCFGYLGTTPGMMISNMIHHPRLWLDHETLTYWKQLITPTWLASPFVSPVGLLALPYAGINMLGENGGCNTAAIYRHYSLIPGALLFVSVIVSGGFLAKWLAARDRLVAPLKSSLPWFLFAAAAASLVFVTGSAQFGDLHPQPWHDSARAIAKMIPADAPVAVPRYMLPLMANRMELYQSLRLLEYHDPQPKFIVIDEDWERQGATEQWRPEFEQMRAFVAGSPSYERYYDHDGFAVYRLCAGCKVTFPEVPTSGGGLK